MEEEPKGLCLGIIIKKSEVEKNQLNNDNKTTKRNTLYSNANNLVHYILYTLYYKENKKTIESPSLQRYRRIHSEGVYERKFWRIPFKPFPSHPHPIPIPLRPFQTEWLFLCHIPTSFGNVTNKVH
jgi:hypothetical protein